MDADYFIYSIGETCAKICPVYNLPASVCIAQAAIESGWGEYVIGDYNYFGRKAGDTDTNYEPHLTEEYKDGEWVTEVAKFKKYNSLEEAVEDWCILMREEGAYHRAMEIWDSTFNLTDFVNEMADSYATDPNYAYKILSTIRANNLTAYDNWEVDADE